MMHDVVMPKLAMGMSEGTVIEWKVEQGEQVEKGHVLLEIETEKVTYEIESTEAGVVNILTPAGETVPTYHVIAQIADSAAEFSAGDSDAEVAAPAAKETTAPAGATSQLGSSSGERIIASPIAKKLAKEHGIDLAQIAGTGPNGKIDKGDVLAFIESGASAQPEAASVKASPVAKKLAKEHGIDLGQITGTGPGGKIGKDDVLTAIEQQAVAPTAPAVPAAAASGEPGVKATLPLRGLRGAIAANMMKSLATTAQLTATMEYDASEIVALRKALLTKEEQLGLRISYLDIMTMIFARAAQQAPIVNAAIVGEEIKVWEDVNIGIAVATEISEFESGLFVPVVKDAGRKSLGEICRDIRMLTGKIKDGSLTPDLMQGGTMTLSSAAFGKGMIMATPVLSAGQAMLVQPGPIEEKPVVVDGEVVARPMMTVNYTFDHRIVDGVPFGKYSNAVRELIECPATLLI